MLGGSFWIAMLRHMMGAALMMGVFFLLDRPRFSIKRTAVYYCVFGVLAAAVFGATLAVSGAGVWVYRRLCRRRQERDGGGAR